MITSSPILGAAVALHIPDGFLNVWVAVVCWLAALGVLAYATRRAESRFSERLAPLAGILAAFIFAAQMLNFPVASGTSGHFIGATLAFVVLGPSLGLLVMTAVVVLQALLFQDGGLLVMGANIIGMGIAPGYLSYLIVRSAQRLSPRAQTAATAVAAWSSVMIAALVVTLLLLFSGVTTPFPALPAMLGVHALIGVGEALITVGALRFVQQTRPDLLTADGRESARGSWVVVGLVLTLLVVLAAPLASGHPDGLEWVAEQTGFLDAARDAPYQIFPDYTIPGLGETSLSTILAGVIGALATAVLAAGTAGALLRQRRNAAASADAPRS